MRTATGLTVVAVGAILAFAVTAHPSFLNIQVVGWILIITGVCGLVIPRRGRGWLRRSVLVKGSPDYTDADLRAQARRPVAPSLLQGSGSAGSAMVDGSVERESVVEFMEK